MRSILALAGRGAIRLLGALLSRLLGIRRSSRLVQANKVAGRPAVRRHAGFWKKGTAKDVLVVTGLVVLCSGFVRGRGFDELLGHYATALREGSVHFLSDGWLHPTIAAIAIRGLGLLGCAAAMLLFAGIFTSIPSFTSYLALSHLGEVQGRRPCKFDMVVGVSLPISFAIALCSYSALGLLAAAYFGCAYLYVRTLYDAKAMNRTLEWYVRLHNPLHSALRGPGSGEIDMEMEEPRATG